VKGNPPWDATWPCRLESVIALATWLVVGTIAGCAAPTRLPEVDLSSPGWAVRSGQARWQRGPDRPALAGELIAARHADGDVLVVFSKPPFPIFTAHTADGLWQIDFAGGGSYSGRGAPPSRFIWFYVPGILQGAPAPEGWQVEALAPDDWSITNHRTGEAIRLVLDP
jgi:hypothetical protein